MIQLQFLFLIKCKGFTTKETRDNTLSATVLGHKKRSFNPICWIVLYDDVNCQYKMYLMYVFITVDLNGVRLKKKVMSGRGIVLCNH